MRDDAIALAKMRLEDLLSFFGINAKVNVCDTGEVVELTTDAADTAHLIGRHGETLRSLQYLVNQMVRLHTTERVFFSVDIAGYKKGRDEKLVEQAREAAVKVAETGESFEFPPMTAAERRVIHSAVTEMTGVTTESVGQEPHRRIVIKPE